MLEAVTGTPLADLLDDDDFRPAGMTGTHLAQARRGAGREPAISPTGATTASSMSGASAPRRRRRTAGRPREVRPRADDRPPAQAGEPRRDGARRPEDRLCRARRLVVHRPAQGLRCTGEARRAARRDRRRPGAQRHRPRPRPRADRLHRPPVRLRRSVAGQGRQLRPVLRRAYVPHEPDRVRLGVNIDHVATIRNARGGDHPDPVARGASLRSRRGPTASPRTCARTGATSATTTSSG